MLQTQASQTTSLLNFVLTGEVRSGTGVVASILNAKAGVVCHTGMLDGDIAARKARHAAYFGTSVDVELENPWHYLDTVLLDNPQCREQAIGCHVSYSVVRQYDLYDLFEQRGIAGDFCLVHVVRNPAACFVSRRQAELCGIWSRPRGSKPDQLPPPVRVDATALTEFCRLSAAITRKVRATCTDALELTYYDLLVNTQDAICRLYDFLELPPVPELVRPPLRRLDNRDMPCRVANLVELRREVPTDVEEFLNADDFL